MQTFSFPLQIHQRSHQLSIVFLLHKTYQTYQLSLITIAMFNNSRTTIHGDRRKRRRHSSFLILAACFFFFFFHIINHSAATPPPVAGGGSGRAPTTTAAFIASVDDALSHARSARSMAYNMTISYRRLAAGRMTGMDDCRELLDITMEKLAGVLTTMSSSLSSSSFHDVRTWLSAALTNQVTCSESLAQTSGAGAGAGSSVMSSKTQSLMKLIGKSLALLSGDIAGEGRKLISGERFPAWLSEDDRRLLRASPAEIKPHAVVAKDGSGTHSTVGGALAFVASKVSGDVGGGGRMVIHVKEGRYKEVIRIPTKQKHVMLMGDGKGKSVIVGGRSAAAGWSTYETATVGAMGDGFIARGLTIINDAGPEGHQAVALRVGADLAVVADCSIEGHQDTLYAHSNRQFYAGDDVSGTVDFVFGNAAAVFQGCVLRPQKPSSGQKDTITAQGRTDPNQNSGFSIQNCRVEASPELLAGSSRPAVYLGRPWQKYSRTVFMESYIDGSVSSAGWEEWSGEFALSTLFYGEYRNSGPGADIAGRVRWPGVKAAMSAAEAAEFTVEKLIAGDEWLPATGVDYKPGL